METDGRQNQGSSSSSVLRSIWADRLASKQVYEMLSEQYKSSPAPPCPGTCSAVSAVRLHCRRGALTSGQPLTSWRGLWAAAFQKTPKRGSWKR